jgi:hypothetical protein
MEKIFSKIQQWAVSGTFLLLIFLPTFQAQFQFYKEPVLTEKRALANAPVFNWRDPWIFPGQYEAYFNDHFGFRRLLIEWNGIIKMQIFPEPVSPNPGAIAGKDGWIFFDAEKSGDGISISDFLGRVKYSETELETIRYNFDTWYGWTAEQNIPFVFMIVPNKETIYAEYLPDWIREKRGVSRLDQMKDYLSKNSRFSFLDLRGILLDKKKAAQTYYKTDSHWNYFGAFWGYEAAMKELAKKNPEFEPYSFNDFEMSIEEKDGGDLAKIVGLESRLKDVEMVFRLKDSVPKKKKFAKVVIFTDSTGPYLVNFFSLHFDSVGLCHPPTVDFEVLEREKPDAAVLVYIER